MAMIIQENMHEAKTHFSALVQRVLAGDQVVIAKAGNPVVQLIPYTRPSKGRTPGSARSLFEINEDFDAPLADQDLEDWGL
jgi:prevent-host-death family protein